MLDAPRHPAPEGRSSRRASPIATSTSLCERFGTPLEGLRIVVDCANGALSDIAPTAFERLGAAVTAIAASPDGTNINAGCGATDLSLLAATVRGGDRPRRRLRRRRRPDARGRRGGERGGRRPDPRRSWPLHLGVELVVVTAMTNLGFHRLMAERGHQRRHHRRRRPLRARGPPPRRRRARRRAVRPRPLPRRAHHRGRARRGPPALRGARRARRDARRGGLRHAALAAGETERARPHEGAAAGALERRSSATRGSAARGRVLVRPSGTEPVVRVLAEAEREEEAEKHCATMAALVEREIGSA